MFYFDVCFNLLIPPPVVICLELFKWFFCYAEI